MNEACILTEHTRRDTRHWAHVRILIRPRILSMENARMQGLPTGPQYTAYK